MHAGLALQYVVIALVVTISAVFVMRKQFPNATRRLRIAIAVPLLRESTPAWMKSLGRGIAPTPLVGTKGCAGCDSCE